VTTAVGGAVRSGVPAENVQLDGASGITHDPSGHLVFCEHYTVRRLNPDGTIQTIAGTGVSGFSGDGGPATLAQLEPSSPQYDSKGNLYFNDAGTRIRRVDPHGVITTFAGTGIPGALGANGPLVDAQIDFASSLVIGPDDSLYIAEVTDIRRITPQGTIDVIGGPGACLDGGPVTPGAICYPHSLALDSSGNIYFVGDGLDISRIYRLSPGGSVTPFAGFGNSTSDGGPAMEAFFYGITALALDASGNMFVADSVNVSSTPSVLQTVSVIRRIAASDGTITTIAGQATSPSPYEGPALHVYLGNLYGLAPNSDGSLSFASIYTVGQLTTQSTIQLLSGRNVQLPPDGTKAAGDSWFSLPVSVQMAPSRSGNFFYADHCMIRKVGTDGLLATVAGTGNCAAAVPNTYGPGIDLPPIGGLAVDSRDNVRVWSNSNIYSLTSGGTMSAITGIQSPSAMAFDSQDRLYVVQNFGDVFRVETDGTVKDLNWTSQLQQGTPFRAFAPSIAIDPSDNVYVLTASAVNCCNYALYRFTPDGVGAPFVGLSAVANMTYSYTVDALGGIWFIGNYENTLQHANPSELPLAMTVCCGYSGDGGPVIAADFDLITGSSVTNDGSGNIYVLDAGNAVIRKISGAPPANAPVISPGGITNAASLLGGAIAPGELISIFGSNFGTAGLQMTSPVNNSFPTTLGNLRVFIGGSQGGAYGVITAATPNQINVFVPYEIAGNTSVTITVSADYVGSAPVSVPVAQSAFGLLTDNASGSGQGAILNLDGSTNNDKNPAAAGSFVSLFGTGEGVTTPPLPDGALVISTPYSLPNQPVTVTIGDQPAKVFYAGAAPFLATGVLQINAQIPVGVTGDAAVLVSVGGVSTSRVVTVAVK
jgi:uncharacterized protein (TIGR03437 family)